MFILVAFFVIVLMLNLLIAIMGDSYEKVKEAETVEGLLGKAKMIVNAELLHDAGSFIMMASNRNHYPAYMHIVEAVDDDEGPGRPWEGVAGRVREEMAKQRLEAARLHTELQGENEDLNARLTSIEELLQKLIATGSSG